MGRFFSLTFLALFCSNAIINAFLQPTSRTGRVASYSNSQRGQILTHLSAKKGKGGGEKRGFEKKVVTPVDLEPSAATNIEAGSSSVVTEVQQTGGNNKGVKNEGELFKKYGISDGENLPRKKKAVKKERAEDAAFGEEVLAGIPFALQQKIDNILIISTLVSLTFVVFAGIGMSAGALNVVFPDIILPEALDGLISNFLTPAFTPGVGVFFFFSVTFGLFKFAQISSSQTVYRE